MTLPLLPFQKGAVNFGLHTKKIALYLPAGAGKTLVALATAEAAKVKPVLIICPVFLRLHWMWEIQKWFPKSSVSILRGRDSVPFYKGRQPDFTIVGYTFFESDGIRNRKGKKEKKNASKILNHVRLLALIPWKMVICDESQYLRRWESERCRQVVLHTCRKRERLIFMTATPLVTSAADLHPTFSIMQPGKWGSYSDFREEFAGKKPDVFSPNGVKYIGIEEGKGTELKKRGRDFIFTAKKKDILKQLPPVRVIDMPIDVGGGVEFDNLMDMIDSIVDTGDDEGFDEVKTERERIGLLKMPDALELVDTFPKEDEAVVIFAWHQSVVKGLAEKLECPMIIGGMSEKKRMQVVSDFKEGKTKRLVVSIEAGGTGLDGLQVASIAVFVELPYSWSAFEQACYRVHRIGSKKAVRIFKMIAIDTIDASINKAIETKRDAAEDAGVLTGDL